MHESVPPESRMAVERRSGGFCELAHPGCRGRATELHHRKLRRFGDHRPENLIALCFVAHSEIHRRGQDSYDAGWLVRSWGDPARIGWERSME